jgi:type I restriction enzyme S subunit
MIVNRDILNNLCINITDGEHASVQNDEAGKYFLLSNKNIINGQIVITNNERKISHETFAKINKRTRLEKGDLVISTVGILGKLAIIKDKNLNYDFQRSVGMIKCDESILNTNYLYHYLNADFVQLRLNYLSKGAVQKCLFISDIKNLEIDFPDILTQQKIASVLSALDSKIELNNRINAELEAMAKTLYDYWFVQFDFPDKHGKPYKTSGGTLVWNEELKREIPEGWELLDLEKVENNIVTGKTPSTTNSNFYNGNIPFITIGDVRGNMHIVSTVQKLTKDGANQQANKFIPKGAICVTCIASPGLVGFATEDSHTNQQLNSVVCENFENRYYLYFYLTDYFKYSSAKTGNTFANMNKGDFSAIQVIKPKKEILVGFSNILKSSIDKILINSHENQKLTALRDWLLPMLMNGQVKVN